MNTEIFENYDAFLARPDKRVNGVSPEFAEAYPNYASDNVGNTGCWNCRDCNYCTNCKECTGSAFCRNCWHCMNCESCTMCNSCDSCSDCDKQTNKTNFFNNSSIQFPVPKIENIHQKVWEAVQVEGALNMQTWHQDGFCGTTHCRAGHVIVLAGEEGRKFEEATSHAFAAMQIYKASSQISVPNTRFFQDETEAMADIEQCRILEAFRSLK